MACKPTAQIEEGIMVESKDKSSYKQLPENAKWADWLNKDITFIAQKCEMEHQHMLKMSIDGRQPYLCLDTDVSQILAYYLAPSYIKHADNEQFRVYGTLHSMSTDSGKGGKPHTEYYLDLDALDEVK